MIVRRTNQDGKPLHAAKDNISHIVKKPREYRRHEAITDMIDKANSALGQDSFKG